MSKDAINICTHVSIMYFFRSVRLFSSYFEAHSKHITLFNMHIIKEIKINLLLHCAIRLLGRIFWLEYS
jgi:hypothetical protein